MRKLWIVPIIITFVSIVAANTVFAGEALDRIKERGVLTIGSTATGVPVTFLDTKSGEITGIMVDIAQELANHLGVELKVVETPWSSLIPSLLSHKIDSICAAMCILEKRLKVVAFTDPIFPYDETLVVRKDDPKDYKSIDDIRGMKVGAVVGTDYAKNMENEGFEVNIYDSNQDILNEISIGRIDAAVVDGPIVGWLLKTKPEIKARISKSYTPIWTCQVAAALNKEDTDLKEELDKVIEKLHKEGKIKEILTKWGQ